MEILEITSISVQSKVSRIYPPERADISEWRIGKIVPDGIVLHFIWIGTLIPTAPRAQARIVESEDRGERTSPGTPRSLLDIARENEGR